MDRCRRKLAETGPRSGQQAHQGCSTMKHLQAVLLIALVSTAFGSTGCGPIQATQRVSEAEVAVMKAAMAGSDKTAPYEYYTATLYLHKAKEEWGYSDFEASLNYATVAKRSAEEAVRKTEEDPWSGPPKTTLNILEDSENDTGDSE